MVRPARALGGHGAARPASSRATAPFSASRRRPTAAQLARRHRGRAALHHHQAAGVVGQARRRLEGGPRRQRQRHRRHHGVAGAGHVGNLVGAEDRDVHRRRRSRTNSAMPRLPRVMSTACMPRALEHRRGRRARARAASSLMRTPSACSTSDSFGVHAVRPRYSQQPVARVDEHRNRTCRGRRAERAARRDERRRHQPRAVVRHQHRVGARRRRAARGARRPRAPAASIAAPTPRSMRTTCCLAEWMPPARMRVLTGVVARRRPHHVRAVDARVQRGQQPRGRLVACRPATPA